MQFSIRSSGGAAPLRPETPVVSSPKPIQLPTAKIPLPVKSVTSHRSQSQDLTSSHYRNQIQSRIDNAQPKALQHNHQRLSKTSVSVGQLLQARQKLKPVSQHQVLNLGQDTTVEESGRSLKLKTQGSVFAPERLGAQAHLELVGHGSPDGSTLGGMSPQQLAQKLKTEGITQLAVLDLKSCYSASFKTALEGALHEAGIEVGEVRAYKEHIAINRETGNVMQGQDLEHLKGHDGVLGNLKNLNVETISAICGHLDPGIISNMAKKIDSDLQEHGPEIVRERIHTIENPFEKRAAEMILEHLLAVPDIAGLNHQVFNELKLNLQYVIDSEPDPVILGQKIDQIQKFMVTKTTKDIPGLTGEILAVMIGEVSANVLKQLSSGQTIILPDTAPDFPIDDLQAFQASSSSVQKISGSLAPKDIPPDNLAPGISLAVFQGKTREDIADCLHVLEGVLPQCSGEDDPYHTLNINSLEPFQTNPFVNTLITQLAVENNENTTMKIGGFDMQIKANTYVTFADAQYMEIFPKSSGIDSGSPTYPGLADAVYQAVEINHSTTHQALAAEVKQVLLGHNTEEPLAAILAATLGGAETVRNPKSLALLMMYTDLIAAGQTDWMKGLGPTSTPEKQRKPIESSQGICQYFGIPYTDNKGMLRQQVKAFVEPLQKLGLDSELLQPLLKVANLTSKQGKIKVGDIGGELAMTGGGTVALGKSSDVNTFNRVQTQEAAIMLRWMALKAIDINALPLAIDTLLKKG